MWIANQPLSLTQYFSTSIQQLNKSQHAQFINKVRKVENNLMLKSEQIQFPIIQ